MIGPHASQRYAAGVVLAAACALANPTARAERNRQANDSERSAEAARLFETATEHADRGETAEALEFFQRSLEIFPTTATAFNLALTLHDTGRVVEAIELIEQLMEGEYGELPPDRLTEARQQRRLYQREVAALEIHVSGATTAEIRVDGTRAGAAQADAPLRIQVDPGIRVITAQSGAATSETEVDVSRGERKEITLVFDEADEALFSPLPSSTSNQEDSESSVFEEPWFWIVTGLVVAGATVGTVVALQGDDGATPEPIPLFGRHEVLRATW